VGIVAAPQPTAYALIVGIEKYRDLPSPTGARRDAEQFAAMVQKTLGLREDHVRVALDDRATRSDLLVHFAWLKANVPTNGRIYFFFSGHGAPDAATGTPYLLPYTGSPATVEATAIPLSLALKELADTKAKDVLAVVDTCFSGAGGRSVLPQGARPLVLLKEAAPTAQVALFAASGPAQISGPSEDGTSGVFTKFVVDALGQAQADADGDGQITLEELSEWVRPRVERESRGQNRAQTPTLTLGVGIGDAKNFVVAYGLPAK
jgi:uncharacterized caspase-like protein